MHVRYTEGIKRNELKKGVLKTGYAICIYGYPFRFKELEERFNISFREDILKRKFARETKMLGRMNDTELNKSLRRHKKMDMD